MFFLATLLHVIAQYLPNKWNDDAIVWQFPYYRSLEVEFTRSHFVDAILGTFFCAWYAAQKHWLANNILGLAFCIQGIEMLSLGSFTYREYFLLWMLMMSWLKSAGGTFCV